MSLYCCDKCKCVENTAGSPYWFRNDKCWPKEIRGLKLCCECAPSTFEDGEPSGYGVWHNNFPKKSARGMLIDERGFLWSKEQVEAGLLAKDNKIVGEVL